jgi:DNA ligase-1
MTTLLAVAEASAEIAGESARGVKTKRLAAVLHDADIADVATIVAWLSGELVQRRVGVGWAALATIPPAAASPSLVVADVNRAFAEMAEASGPGSQTLRSAKLFDTMSKATPVEQTFLRGLLAGNLRQGALAGVMVEAIAKAASVTAAEVRRAAMLRGNLPAVADAAMRGGSAALAQFQLQVGCALAPMLAQTASSVEDALADLRTADEPNAAFEAKLDGARIQIHKWKTANGPEVRLFTRSLDDVTARLGHVARDIASWPAESLVADGEILWFAFHGESETERPLPFQETASRFASHEQAERPSIFLFDVLHVDGVDFLDRPNSERRAALEGLKTSARLVDRLVTADASEAKAFFDRMVTAGYEGVVAKSLSAPYEAGRRGASWRKIKPVLTLDLVVLAVEWGSGRRTGKLSNIHLGARDPKTGGFVMLGKTFKGMTDAMLEWQTRRFLELAEGPTDGYVVKLRPEQVVEIALDGVQTSSRYPGKMALRFARVLRYRDDKQATEADTVDAVRAIHARAPDS